MENMMTAQTVETVNERIIRLALLDVTRLETLTEAHDAGVDDATFAVLSDSLRVSRQSTITLPTHRLESMSRGRGWARLGQGSSVVWGERSEKGYSVGAGRWVVGGSDGYSRKGEDTWQVAEVKVGNQMWLVAN
jgi:hypothetical protein